MSSSSSSISSSFRLVTARIPTSLFHSSTTVTTTRTRSKTLLHSHPKPLRVSFSRPISFERIPSVKVSASASSSTSLQPIEELPPKLQEIVRLFQSVQEPKAKYEQLLFYGKNLKPLDAHFKTKRNKVEGCVSQVWVRAYLDSDKNVVYEADSDSVLTKGLAALLVNGLSGRPVDEVVRISPDFAMLLGLQQSLTPSRNNGFLNMLKLMQKKALELYVEAEKGVGSSNSESKFDNNGESSSLGLKTELGKIENKEEKVVESEPATSVRSHSDSNSESKFDNNGESSSLGLKTELGIENKEEKVVESESEPATSVRSQSDSNSGSLGSRGMRIKERLEKELSPVDLEVEDVSYQHAGHAGVRGSNGETHFNVKIVSKEFEGKSLVKRHRLIYNLLQEELQSGLHALSIVAKTPSEVSGE